jgi:hypothetical protein
MATSFAFCSLLPFFLSLTARNDGAFSGSGWGPLYRLSRTTVFIFPTSTPVFLFANLAENLLLVGGFDWALIRALVPRIGSAGHNAFPQLGIGSNLLGGPFTHWHCH